MGGRGLCVHGACEHFPKIEQRVFFVVYCDGGYVETCNFVNRAQVLL